MNENSKRSSGLPPELETELRREGMRIQPREQFPGKTGDNRSEGKHKAFTPTTKPTEKKTMNQSTIGQNSAPNFSSLTPDQQVAEAAKLAAQAAQGINEMLSLKRQALVIAATATTTVAVGYAVWGVTKWLSGPSTSAKPIKN